MSGLQGALTGRGLNDLVPTACAWEPESDFSAVERDFIFSRCKFPVFPFLGIYDEFFKYFFHCLSLLARIKF